MSRWGAPEFNQSHEYDLTLDAPVSLCKIRLIIASSLPNFKFELG